MIKSKQSFFFPLLVLALAFFTFSCNQDNLQDSVTPNAGNQSGMETTLRNALGKSDTTDQNDFCFSFNFPIQVQQEDGTVLTANDHSELAAIASLIDSLDVDADFVYPFSVTLADGTSQAINDYDDFDDLLRSCFGDFGGYDDDDHADCPDDYDFDLLYDCFTLVYPISITDSTQTITFNSEEELEGFLDSLDEATAEYFDFVFPIQVILTEDGSEQTINTYDDLDELIEDCWDEYDDDEDEDYDDDCADDFDFDELYDCFTLVYPISITDSTQTITINSDEELEDFLDGLDEETAEDFDFVFPIQVILTADGSEQTINNYDDIEALIENCDDEDEDDDDEDEDGDDDDDDFEDFLNDCFTVNYPIDFDLEGETVTVNNDQELEDLFLLAEDNDQEVEPVFPLSVTLVADGTTVDLSQEDDLEELLDACDEE